MNDFKNATDKLNSLPDTVKSKIMDISTTDNYYIEPILKEIFLDKINDKNTDIQLLTYDSLSIDGKIKNTNTMKSFFDKNRLKNFIHRFYEASKGKKIIGFQISIPRPLSRTSVIAGTHAVALVINPIKKRIIYQDSTGFDMPQEFKIIFDKCFADYTVIDYHDKNQFTEKNDGSCSYLSMLNIYYRIMDELGRKPDKDLDFTAFAGKDFQTDTRSEKLREYIWKELKDKLLSIELANLKKVSKQQPIPTEKKSTFSFGKSTFVQPVLEDSNYELYKDPEFEGWVDNLAKSLNDSTNTISRINNLSR